jgi:hypothetical protein
MTRCDRTAHAAWQAMPAMPCRQRHKHRYANALLAAGALAALAWPLAAQAQSDPTVVGRSFPATALRGSLQVTMPPEVLVNGQPARLAPGARIRGPNNLLLMSGALVGEKLLVNYTLDSLGNVHMVWMLSPVEAARQPWPSTPEQAARWEFNPAEQRWTRR